MTVSNLVGEELLDPATGTQITLDVQVDMLIFVILHPDYGESCPEANNQKLE